jgi:hypothetical protein
MWQVSATGDGWNYLINRWQSGERIHLENLLGYAQYANAQTGWYSAMWNFVNPVTGRESMHAAETSSEISTVDIYPNPIRGKQFVVVAPALRDDELATISVQDLHGKLSLRARAHNGDSITHDLAPGMYLVHVQGERVRAIRKIVVE